MTEAILLRGDPRLPGHYQWLLAGASRVASGTLQELAAAAAGRQATLLLPAAQVLLLEIDLPVKSASQLRQALPFALEDKLADDVENYHLVWQRQPNQLLAVAAIDKQWFGDSLQTLRGAGIQVQNAYAESLCLPVSDDAISILLEADQASFRNGPWQAGGIDVQALPMLLQGLPEPEPARRQLLVWGDGELPGFSIERQSWREPLQLFAGQMPSLNLLSGEFSARPSGSGFNQRWLSATVVILLTLIVQIGAMAWRNQQLREQVWQQEQQTQALFQQTFPDIKRIVNVKVQADQRLRELQQQQQSGGDDFLRLLHAVGQVLQQTPGLQLRGLHFEAGKLQLKLLAAEQSQLQRLQQALAAWLVDSHILGETPQGVEAQLDVIPH